MADVGSLVAGGLEAGTVAGGGWFLDIGLLVVGGSALAGAGSFACKVEVCALVVALVSSGSLALYLVRGLSEEFSSWPRSKFPCHALATVPCSCLRYLHSLLGDINERGIGVNKSNRKIVEKKS